MVKAPTKTAKKTSRSDTAPRARDLQLHQTRFFKGVDRYLQSFGSQRGLTPRLRKAILASPRHLFVGRFRVLEGEPVRNARGKGLKAQLGLIYSPTITLGYVDAKGDRLPATASEPQFVFKMLELLELKPGMRVLEIGSGGGWLTALMASLVGPRGHATGIEIIDSLARESRRNLAAAGIENATIIAGDGGLGHRDGAPFDRVIFVAGSWDLPKAFFGQVKEGGLLLIPLRTKGVACDLVLLRKREGHFHAEVAIQAFYVPFTGSKAGPAQVQFLNELKFWKQVRNRVCYRRSAPFGGTFHGNVGFRTAAFCSFMTKIEPRFARLARDRKQEGFGFGLIDKNSRSVAYFEPHEIVGYGDMTATKALLAGYRRWVDLFMPSVEPFDLAIHRSGEKTKLPAKAWVEHRGDAELIWTQKKNPRALPLPGRKED